MGLDAVVYCNCFETGNLKEPPPNPSLVYVTADGSLDYKSKDLEEQLAFDHWLLERACQHENGVLLHYYLGNLALVALLYKELETATEEFPLLLKKVLYSGIHAGDYLSLEDISNLTGEINSLDEFVASDERNQSFIDDFKNKMQDLINAALSVNKPISF